MLYNPDSMINLPDTVGISRPAVLLPPTNNVTAAATEESDDQTPTVEEHHQTYNSTYRQNLTAFQLFQRLNKVDDDDDTSSLFNICRSNVWSGAVRGLKRKSFAPSKRLSLLFTDSIGQAEGAIDQGGPRREFFTLIMEEIKQSSLFDGPMDKRVLSFNGAAMAEDRYFHAGQLIAMSLVHGGPSPTFFSNVLYESIAYGISKTTPGIVDVADSDIRTMLQKVRIIT
ncbi:G2/M phase-specific E3 ubiquitin-protein ligase-like [Anneissia japonica]|uniref:G2/M phase-specific E3 ubiquitin-protein ligase-like n=1 Tax=Anneissia japonica TaxID=1529436 RepID=UPI0014255F9B|nr:G2/M phase-specific E3 ubiquitin-protein ligase-like [Anneissia japonica]